MVTNYSDTSGACPPYLCFDLHQRAPAQEKKRNSQPGCSLQLSLSAPHQVEPVASLRGASNCVKATDQPLALFSFFFFTLSSDDSSLHQSLLTV